MDEPVKLVVPLPLVQAVVNYLQQRPFVEVYELIAALSELPRLPDPSAMQMAALMNPPAMPDPTGTNPEGDKK